VSHFDLRLFGSKTLRIKECITLKSTFAFARIAALAVASMLSFTSVSIAASHPLNSPQGLAVAANGNLYVANTGGNQVLVYSPAHAQLTAKTITANISSPASVAFDPSGNVWVANTASSSITEYSPNGVQNTANTVTSSIFSPYAIAFDSLNDLWVNSSYSFLSIYALQPGVPPGAFTFSMNYNNPITAIATWREYAVLGGNFSAEFFQISPYLVTGNIDGPGELGETCFGAAFDNAGNLYCANLDQSLTFYPAGDVVHGKIVVANMGFVPFGLAIDKTRGFIYVSNGIGNSIAVYNTTGTLLDTIKN
jgi:DNA-binding beta-propeller fold protein YncE